MSIFSDLANMINTATTGGTGGQTMPPGAVMPATANFAPLMAQMNPAGWSNPNAQAWTQQALSGPYLAGWGPVVAAVGGGTTAPPTGGSGSGAGAGGGGDGPIIGGGGGSGSGSSGPGPGVGFPSGVGSGTAPGSGTSVGSNPFSGILGNLFGSNTGISLNTPELNAIFNPNSGINYTPSTSLSSNLIQAMAAAGVPWAVAYLQQRENGNMTNPATGVGTLTGQPMAPSPGLTGNSVTGLPMPTPTNPDYNVTSGVSNPVWDGGGNGVYEGGAGGFGGDFGSGYGANFGGGWLGGSLGGGSYGGGYVGNSYGGIGDPWSTFGGSLGSWGGGSSGGGSGSKWVVPHTIKSV